MFPSFTFTAPSTLVYGWGAIAQLPQIAATHGRRPLVVAGGSLRRSSRLASLLDALRSAGLDPRVLDTVPPEPTVADLQRAMDAAAALDFDSVIAIGGGSVLDIGKAVAVLAGAPEAQQALAAEYFAGRPLPATGRPILACPTTAGTSSEHTRNCVLTDPATRRKASIRGDAMLPTAAIVDPDLTVTCPPSVTAHSGIDALVQAIEAYVSRGANPLTDALALAAARLAWRWLPVAFEHGDDRPAREGMALASTVAGLAFNTARLGLVHGLAHPLGAVTKAPHGLLCGMLLPPVVEFNLPAAGAKYAHLARALEAAAPGDPDMAAAAQLQDALRGLLRRLGISQRLREIGLRTEDVDHVAAEALPSGSTRANPRPVSLAEARALVAGAW
ncbi:MAG: iron-containing alcohol dehydrogenase [Armatimonadetes bacterium]|nr:iron-containing alcohol dehydrogenase [Armatimonadota bacterium]